MPKNATAAKTSKGRAKVKSLPRAAQDLTSNEAKKVKGGIIIINNQPTDPSLKPGGAVPPELTNPGNTVGQKVK